MLFQSVMKGIIENGVPVKFNPRISVGPHVNFVFIDRVIVIIGHLMFFVPKNRVGDQDLFNEFSICFTRPYCTKSTEDYHRVTNLFSLFRPRRI